MADEKFTRPGGVSPLSIPTKSKRRLRKLKELWARQGLMPGAYPGDTPSEPNADEGAEVRDDE